MKKHTPSILPLTLVLTALVVLSTGCTETTTNTASTTNAATTANTANSAPTNAVADPEGTIVVEAGDGTLTGATESSVDYIKESARGLEAYLGSKGATANYTVTAARAGTYKLHVKLTDDGTWKNGYRDADITVNGNAVLKYLHTSEDTHGWKWYTVGNASLKVGANTVSFTKTNDMPAAYTMDEFKFVPVALAE